MLNYLSCKLLLYQKISPTHEMKMRFYLVSEKKRNAANSLQFVLCRHYIKFSEGIILIDEEENRRQCHQVHRSGRDDRRGPIETATLPLLAYISGCNPPPSLFNNVILAALHILASTFNTMHDAAMAAVGVIAKSICVL